jgi:phosphatidylethanolamine-binding protein (PEBP) family uncharacterized protein
VVKPILCAVLLLASPLLQAAMEIDFQFSVDDGCTVVSPEIRLFEVPPETRSLDITMDDQEAGGYHTAHQAVAYAGGNVVERGAIAPFAGPCPGGRIAPGRQTLHFQFVVIALDADGKELDRAAAIRPFNRAWRTEGMIRRNNRRLLANPQ